MNNVEKVVKNVWVFLRKNGGCFSSASFGFVRFCGKEGFFAWFLAVFSQSFRQELFVFHKIEEGGFTQFPHSLLLI